MRFTLWGISQYRPDFWDFVEVPPSCNKKWLIDLILQRSGMLYPYQQQPDFLQLNIEQWFLRRNADFEKLFVAMQVEYNPIENYDRTESLEEIPNISFVKTGGHVNKSNGENSLEVDMTVAGRQDVAAYNTESYSNDTSVNNTQNGTNTNSTTNTETFTYNDETVNETGNRKHQNHIHGNIGVTTNQEMIRAELNLRALSVYDIIAELFENEFLIQVY